MKRKNNRIIKLEKNMCGWDKIELQEKRAKEIQNHINQVSLLIEEIDQKEDKAKWELSHRNVLSNIFR